MKTRQQYLNKECTYREYYGQFVTDYIKQSVARHIGMKRLKASTDEHMNDIDLRTWDSTPGIATHSTSNAMKERGDYLTQAGITCIAKEAARQLLEESK